MLTQSESAIEKTVTTGIPKTLSSPSKNGQERMKEKRHDKVN